MPHLKSAYHSMFQRENVYHLKVNLKCVGYKKKAFDKHKYKKNSYDEKFDAKQKPTWEQKKEKNLLENVFSHFIVWLYCIMFKLYWAYAHCKNSSNERCGEWTNCENNIYKVVNSSRISSMHSTKMKRFKWFEFSIMLIVVEHAPHTLAVFVAIFFHFFFR